MRYCHILLNPLLENEIDYNAKGLKYLTSSKKFNPELTFNKKDFIQKFPVVQKGMSISGYQPKLQVVLANNQFTIIEHRGDYILKPSPESYPFLAENEHSTMQLMRELKFDVPPNGLVYFKQENHQQKEFAFVIKRYDREKGQVIHQEQLDGAMGILEKFGKIRDDGEQYVSYEQAVKFILKNAKNHLALQIALFRRIVYAYLLANNDMHLRNLSLVYSESGEIKLAPVYDFVSTAPYPEIFNSCLLALPLLEREEGGKQLANGFETKYGQYIGVDFIEFGINIGLSKNLTKKLLTELLSEEKKVLAIYQKAFLPQADKDRIINCYKQRLGYLQIFETEKI